MSVQIRSQVPVHRPLGQVMPAPATDGMVELRLHGVGGTSPGDLLGDVSPQLVAGDRIAGFYRTADQPAPATETETETETEPSSLRHIEAYSWGGLTSRSASRVLWVLLLPFALANVAGWMCTPKVLQSGKRFRLHRFVIRLAGLVMTLNIVILLLMTGEDLIGARCSNSSTCRSDFAVASVLHKYWFTDHTGRAMAAGAMLPVAVIVFFYILSRVSSSRYEKVRAPQKAGNTAVAEVAPEFGGTAARPGTGLSDPDFWHGYQAARRLSMLHLAAGFAVVAGVLAWTTHHTLAASHRDVGSELVFWSSVGIVVLVVVSLGWDTTAPWWTRPLLCLSGAVAIGAVVDAWMIGKTVEAPVVVAGMRWVANGMYALVAVVIVVTALVVLFSGGRTSGSFLAGGPAVVLAFAFGLVNAVGSLIIMRFRSWLGFPEFSPPDLAKHRDQYMYTFIDSAAIWCMSTAIVTILAFTLVALARWWRRGHRDNAAILDQYGVPSPPETDSWMTKPDPSNLTPEDRQWLGKIARARFFARLPRRADLLLALIVAVTIATMAVVEYLYWRTDRSIQPPSLVATIASYIATLVPLGLLAFMRWGWNSNTARRHVGVAWDVATFWPRAYHPFAPPCYAERAVPDLQWRLWYLQDKGSTITIAAHSQGSVIAAAALLQQDSRKPGSALGLVTFGSPLDTLYRWAFPSYFSDEVLRAIEPPPPSNPDGPAKPPSPNEPASVSIWQNFYYHTDYIGNTSITGATNCILPDPPHQSYVTSQPRPSIGAHTGYWTDPAVWAGIENLEWP